MFASQHEEERGFFVSLHELTSTYPTLSRRVRDLRALQTGQPARSPSRNPLAYLLALLMPGGQLAYTRAGNLELDAQGQLVTTDGYLIEPAIAVLWGMKLSSAMPSIIGVPEPTS